MKKQHEEMMLAVKEKHDAPQKVVIEIDSPNKDVDKNEPHGDDLGTPKEHPKEVPEMNDNGDHKRDESPSNESSHKFNFDDPTFRRQTIEVQNVQKESETEVKNVAFQHSIDNTIDDFSSPVSAIQSEELLQKENLPDLILPTNNTGVQNELQVSYTVISSEAFQEMIDNIIVGMSTPIVAMAESTNAISTDLSQESIDNIMAGISTPVVAIKMKSVSPTEMNNNECQIHDTRFQSDLSEVELGKQDAIKTRAPRNRKRPTIFRSPFTTKFDSSCKGKESATVDFLRKHPFDGCLIFDDMPMGLIKEYCDWIVKGLLKFMKRTYKDKMSKVVGDLNDTPFDVQYVEDIAQQVGESLDCGVFVAAYAEFLSDEMQIPSSTLDAEYIRKRYATLLWNYGVKKAKKIYSSDHDDPSRVRPFYVPPTDASNILAIE
ncbi:hypothetical protein BC332_32795 [Capsicum chinense]|nr:hypothetical protein BC332_32795 [Capsicum chinense]